MSIVIVGGHDRMVGQYKKICKSYGTGPNSHCLSTLVQMESLYLETQTL